MKRSTMLLPLLVTLLLAACGDNGRMQDPIKVDTPETRAMAEQMRQQKEAQQKATEAKALAQAREAQLPNADQSTPLANYQEIRSDIPLMQIYYALSGLPVPWERLAERVSNDYRSTGDGFQRQEIMKVLKPKLEQDIADYAKNRYVVIPAQIRLSAYDFNQQGFPITGFDPGSYLSFNGSNYVLTFANGEQFRMAKLGNENLAREIEAIRAKEYRYQDHRAKIYAFARDAGDEGGRYAVKAQVVKVVVEKPDGSTWFEY